LEFPATRKWGTGPNRDLTESLFQLKFAFAQLQRSPSRFGTLL
jgi:hypothetical protein